MLHAFNVKISSCLSEDHSHMVNRSYLRSPAALLPGVEFWDDSVLSLDDLERPNGRDGQ